MLKPYCTGVYVRCSKYLFSSLCHTKHNIVSDTNLQVLLFRVSFRCFSLNDINCIDFIRFTFSSPGNVFVFILSSTHLFFFKTVVICRMYGKFMSYRSYIRKSISQVFFRYIYETGRYGAVM